MGFVRVVPERKSALAISGAESTQTGLLHVVVGKKAPSAFILRMHLAPCATTAHSVPITFYGGRLVFAAKSLLSTEFIISISSLVMCGGIYESILDIRYLLVSAFFMMPPSFCRL